MDDLPSRLAELRDHLNLPSVQLRPKPDGPKPDGIGIYAAQGLHKVDQQAPAPSTSLPTTDASGLDLDLPDQFLQFLRDALGSHLPSLLRGDLANIPWEQIYHALNHGFWKSVSTHSDWPRDPDAGFPLPTVRVAAPPCTWPCRCCA